MSAYGAQRRYTPSTSAKADRAPQLASPRQARYIADLLRDRQVPDMRVGNLKELRASFIAAGAKASWTAKRAIQSVVDGEIKCPPHLIDVMLLLPHSAPECVPARKGRKSPAARPAKPLTEVLDETIHVTGPGVFRMNGTIYVVAPPRSKEGHLYAKELVPTSGNAMRRTRAGTTIPFDLVRRPGLVFSLREEHRLSLAQANEISAIHASCFCGAHLYAADTIAECERTGMWVGPVCRKRYFPQPSQQERIEDALAWLAEEDRKPRRRRS